MREIKFRAKLASTGEWVFGVPLTAKYDDIEAYGMVYEIEHNPTTGFKVRKYEDIIPETLGQFMGLKFNEIDLYEGDILEWFQQPAGYPLDKTLVRYTKLMQVNNLVSGDFLFNFYNYKIAGNIHDNPELL